MNYDNKCIHVCPAGRHVMAVHAKDDTFEECDRIERDRHCAKCDRNDTGSSAIRVYKVDAFDKLEQELRASFGPDVALDPDRLARAIEDAVKALSTPASTRARVR